MTKHDNITEEDKEKFINQNSFYCDKIRGRITEKTCKELLKTALGTPIYEPKNKCIKCHKYKKSKENVRAKPCELATNYPSHCLGTGTIIEKYFNRPYIFNKQRYCTAKCAVRAGHYRRKAKE